MPGALLKVGFRAEAKNGGACSWPFPGTPREGANNNHSAPCL
jgi:hypothetical protein